jgi:hypothetical protein
MHLTMPDLFDFFKQQESKLHERPAEHVWQKLQGRLESNRRPRRKGIRFLQLGTVAWILLLLLLAAVMVWYFTSRHPRRGTESVAPSPVPVLRGEVGALPAGGTAYDLPGRPG